MATLKALYLCKNLEELNKKVPSSDRYKQSTPQILCRTADKILLKAKDEVLNGDEEQAYVLYMRFVDVYKCIRASKEYKRDKRELVKLLPSSKAVKAVDEAERLSQSLKDRYAALSAPAGKRSKLEDTNEDGSDGDQIVPSSPNHLTAEELFVNGGIKPLQPNNVQDSKMDLDIFLGGNETTPKTTPTLLPKITARELYDHLTSSPTDVVVLDCRTRGSFVSSHPDSKKFPQWLCVPEETIKNGISDKNVMSFGGAAGRKMWKERDKKKWIVLVDENSSVTQLQGRDETPLMALRDALYKWDTSTSLQTQPAILEGGYAMWYLTYAVMCIGTYKKTPSTNTSQPTTAKSENGVSIDQLSFPSMNDADLEMFEDESMDQTTIELPPTVTQQQIEVPSQVLQQPQLQPPIDPALSQVFPVNVPIPMGIPFTHTSTPLVFPINAPLPLPPSAIPVALVLEGESDLLTPTLSSETDITVSVANPFLENPSSVVHTAALYNEHIPTMTITMSSDHQPAMYTNSVFDNATRPVLPAQGQAYNQPTSHNQPPAQHTSPSYTLPSAHDPRHQQQFTSWAQQPTQPVQPVQGQPVQQPVQQQVQIQPVQPAQQVQVQPVQPVPPAHPAQPIQAIQPPGQMQVPDGNNIHFHHQDVPPHGGFQTGIPPVPSYEQALQLPSEHVEYPIPPQQQTLPPQPSNVQPQTQQPVNHSVQYNQPSDQFEHTQQPASQSYVDQKYQHQQPLGQSNQFFQNQQTNFYPNQNIPPHTEVRHHQPSSQFQNQPSSYVNVPHFQSSSAQPIVSITDTKFAEKDSQIQELQKILQEKESELKRVQTIENEQSMVRQEREKQELLELRQRLENERNELHQIKQTQQAELESEKQQAFHALAQERAQVEQARASIEALKAQHQKEMEIKERQLLEMRQQFEQERSQMESEKSLQLARELEQRQKKDHQRSFVINAGLPNGWEKRLDSKTGRFYYVDHKTHTTHWNPPTNWLNYQAELQRQEEERNRHQQQLQQLQQQQAAQQQAAYRDQQEAAYRAQHQINRPLQPSSSARAIPPPGNSRLANTTGQPTPEAPIPPTQSQASSTPARILPGSNLQKGEVSTAPSSSKLPTPVVDRSIKPVEGSKPMPVVPDRSKKPTAVRRPVMTAALMKQKTNNLQPVFGSGRYLLTGLRNLGNTCYMNSTLQCLSCTTPVMRYFISQQYEKDINHSNPLGHQGQVAIEFAWLMKAMWSGQYKSVSPRDFKAMVDKLASIELRGNGQQDSQELLAFLLDGLHEDLNMVKERRFIEEGDNSHLDDRKAAELAWKSHLKSNRSIIVEYFQGLFRSTIQCTRCPKKSVKFEPFQYLSLPIPPGGGNCTLQDCINLFTKQEPVEWKCPNCKSTNSVKRMEIWKLPPILLVHLKRFSFEGMWREKRQNYVDYPTGSNTLNMSQYVIGEKPQSHYQFYAVSNHFGSLTGGHYTACCRNPFKKAFYNFDDHEVRDALPRQIKSSAAYLLFYTSLDLTPPARMAF